MALDDSKIGSVEILGEYPELTHIVYKNWLNIFSGSEKKLETRQEFLPRPGSDAERRNGAI